MNKLIEYNSGSQSEGLFSLDSALKAFGEVNERTMKYQHICDDIYNRYVNGR